jgi:hypothetical protein
MGVSRWVGSGLLGLAALACDELAAPDQAVRANLPQLSVAGNVVTGGGQFFNPDFGEVTFSFQAVRHGDGGVTGRFQQHQTDLDLTYKGDVTCFAVDLVNHRAWIGGVLTQSNDVDPVAVVGKDAWFRVLDLGSGGPDPDRSTFLGFEGSAGIITSAEYCERQIWPEGNERTWPVEHGDITIQ